MGIRLTKCDHLPISLSLLVRVLFYRRTVQFPTHGCSISCGSTFNQTQPQHTCIDTVLWFNFKHVSKSDFRNKNKQVSEEMEKIEKNNSFSQNAGIADFRLFFGSLFFQFRWLFDANFFLDPYFHFGSLLDMQTSSSFHFEQRSHQTIGQLWFKCGNRREKCGKSL